ncbi:MAG: glycosyltransferase [Bacteroidales bacterium]|jgi:glycosyltransferase involved in cell wall biosynthesis|nr:glycosyltransferase [Bacteroidales bacterium]
MKKILFILPGLGGGGAERVVIQICQYLNKSQFKVVLVVLHKQGVLVDLLPHDIQVIDMHVSRARYSVLSLIRLLNNERPDIVFSTLTHLNIILCFLRIFFTRFKLIIRESNIVSLLLKSNVQKILYRLIISKADVIVAQSIDMFNDLVKNFNCDIKKIEIINNPINIDVIEKQIDEPLDICFVHEKKILLTIGRLEYQKGFDLLIDSFSQLPERNIYQLVILGRGSLRDELEKQVEKQGVEELVSFRDFDLNPYKYMAKADFFISSSRFEGFPNVVIEALACGTPVIANSYLGGIHEIINEDIGSVIDITNVSAFHAALSKRYNSQKIKAYCKRKYSIKEIISQYETVFNI